MPVPGGYGKSTVDFLVCYRGVFIAIEAKAPGGRGKLTGRQMKTLRDIADAGGVTIVVDTIECYGLIRMLDRLRQV